MIDEILKLLADCPQVHCERGEDTVRVLPDNPEGFEVAIEQIWDRHYSVSYGGWHEDFEAWEEALRCFLLGLSNQCRLKVQSKDGNPFKWTVEDWEDPAWVERSTTGSFSSKLFKPAVTAYLHNDVLPDNDLHRLLDKVLTHA